MIKTLILITTVLTALNAQCAEGCLRCHPKTNRCLYCDVDSGYVLAYGRCTLQAVSNCLHLGNDGDCLMCKDNFYLDFNTNTCVAVPTEVTAPNCQVYSDQENCILCKTGYYLKNGGCVAVTTQISNCEVNLSDTQCYSCASGHVPSLDHTSCVSVSTSNCNAYSFLQCRSCVSGYVINNNFSLNHILGYSNHLQLEDLNYHLEFELENGVDQSSYGVCQAYAISNCATYSSFNKCQVCSAGYYLQTDGSCAVYPLERIDFCEKYSSLNTCISCAQGKYLKASNQCADVTVISGCVTYNQTANTSICTQCNANSYLLQNRCVQRTAQSVISNCATLDISSETCATCETGFTLTGDNKKCLASISNCQTYRVTTSSSIAHTCLTCINGYYYDNSAAACVQGGIENCKTYQTNSNVCVVCNNRFYLNGNSCVAQDVLDSCVNYSTSNLNTCTTCDENSYLFTVQNTCAPVDVVPNCESYTTTSNCGTCKYGYYLENGRSCKKIDAGEHCLRKSGNNCILCDDNYVLDGNKCHEALDHVVMNCQSHNVDGLTSFANTVCNYCSENSVPVDYQDNYVCYENEYLADELSVPLDPDCLQYKLVGGVYQCRKCTNRKLLQNGVCVTSCGGSTSTVYSHVLNHIDSDGDGQNDSFSIESVNSCFDTIANCKVATPDLYQPDSSSLNYSCTVCDDSSVPVINLGNEKILLRPPRFDGDEFRLSPVSYITPYTCAAFADTTIVGITDHDGFVDHCEAYYSVDVGTGCLRCDFGFTGIVVDTIFNCKTYTETNRCSECNDGYYLADFETCLPVVDEIKDCVKHSTTASSVQCTRCRESHFLANPTTCTPRTNMVAHCGVFTVGADTCTTCETNFWLDGNTCRPSIYKCTTHVFNVTVKCTACENGYFVYKDRCIEGKVTDCLTYDQAQFNKCTECIPTYFLKKNTCNPTLPVTGCSKYGLDKGVCKQCNAGLLLMSLENKCADVISIDKCEVYKTLTTCERCQKGYYVANDAQRCLPLKPEWNCVTYGNYTSDRINGCIECASDFLLKDGLCRNWYNFIGDKCDKSNADNYIKNGMNNKRVCTYCSGTNEAVSFENDSVCLEQDLINSWSANSGTTAVMPNCDRYEYVSPNMKCLQCSAGYIIKKSDNTCIKIEDCPVNSEIFTMGVTSSTAPSYTKFTTVSGPFCENNDSLTAQPNIKCINAPETETVAGSTIKYRCSKCFDGLLPVIDTTDANMVITKGFGEMTSPIQSFITISQCEDPASTSKTIYGTKKVKNFVKDCEYYYALDGGTTNYGCIACKFGFTGVVKAFDVSGARSFGFIDECNVAVTDCDLDSVMTGIVPRKGLLNNTTFSYSVLFNSCHKCTGSKVPVAYVNGGSTSGYGKIYGLSEYVSATVTVRPAAIGDGDGVAISCEPYTSPIKGISFTNPVPKCALLIANANNTDGSPASNMLDATNPSTQAKTVNAIFCAACEAGYKATRVTANQEVVTNCTQIADCDVLGTGFNACQKCKTNFSFLYDATVGYIQYDVCTANNNDANCMVATSAKECIHCNKGYYKNANGVCEILAPPLCSTYYKNIDMDYTYQQLGYYLAPKPNGCAACTAGYVLAKGFHTNAAINFASNIPANKKYCATRTPATPIVEPIIANCKPTVGGIYNWKYNIPGNANYCIECINGFILTMTGQCVAKTNYDKCKIATDTTSNKCEVCELTYASVAGVCLKTDGAGHVVSNCLKYDDSTLKTGAICTICADTFYLYKETILEQTKYSCLPYSGPITNCAQFDATDPDHIYCTQCMSNYALLVLKDDIQMVTKSGVPTSTPGFARSCVSIASQTDTSCTEWDVDEQKVGKLKCKKCGPAAKHLVDSNAEDDIKNYCMPVPNVSNCATYDISTTLLNKAYNPSLSTYNCLTCAATHYLDDTTHTCVSRTYNSIANCATYEINADACKTCSPNYIITLDKRTCNPSPAINTTPAIVSGNILSCRKMETCTMTMYEGLDPRLDAIASCHKCAIGTQIPFLAVKGGNPWSDITGLNQYSVNPANPLTDAFDQTNGGTAVFCAEPVFTSFNMDTSKFKFPLNCGMGILNTNAKLDASDSQKKALADRQKIAVFCGACAPGYKANYSTDTSGTPIKYMIGECEQILNCESSNWFNYCTQCKPGYSYSYSIATGVNYDVCTSNSNNKDCFAVDGSGNCAYCKKGTYLNEDGYCERITPPRCKFAKFSFKDIYGVQDLSTGLFLDRTGTGCEECERGFSALYQQSSKFVCTKSDYHALGQLPDLPNPSNYLLHCKNYYVENGLLRCQECYAGFIPIIQTRTCIGSSSLPNCKIAASDTTCSECKTGFVLVNRQCQAENIPFCIAYSNNASSIIQNCSECDEGYYLMANVCMPGDVANCLIYETTQVCQQCKDGFTLAKQKNGYSYCYPIDPSTNCQQFDANTIQNGILSCTSCRSNQFVISNDVTLFNPTLCMKFNEIANCVAYDIQNQIGNSTFVCTKCINNFYVNNGACTYRTVVPDNCAAYTVGADTCATCKDGYFLANGNTVCTPYPVGIIGCRQYSDATTCVACDTNKYLSNNTCVAVPTANLISNCVYYLNATSCQQCATNFLLNSGACSFVVATNCATYTNVNTCATCATGYGFQTIDGIKQCVQKNIQQCISSDNEYPFNCNVCNNGYYPLAGVCTSITTTIPYCLEYSTATTCNKCQRGMAVSVDKTKCDSTEYTFDLVDYQCNDTITLDTPSCTSCNLGFYNVSGECIACPAVDGCRSCDPQSVNTCLICKSGYYQTEDGKCTKVGGNPDVTPNPEPNTDSVALMGTLSMLIAFLVLFM